MTGAEREARRRQRKAERAAEDRAAWRRVLGAKDLREAKRIAADVLGSENLRCSVPHRPEIPAIAPEAAVSDKEIAALIEQTRLAALSHAIRLCIAEERRLMDRGDAPESCGAAACARAIRDLIS